MDLITINFLRKNFQPNYHDSFSLYKKIQKMKNNNDHDRGSI